MSQWGIGNPVVWIKGVQYTLPQPYKHDPDPWTEEKNVWKNIKRDRKVLRYGFRRTDGMEWRQFPPKIGEIFTQLSNAGECWFAPWGMAGPRFNMDVDDEREYYVEDYRRLDGYWVRLVSKKLYARKIGPQEFYRVGGVRSFIVN